MKPLSDNLIEEIKRRCNIVDVIGRNVVLKKAGQNYKGLCPFHSEKTPSFVVSETKQYFTCFGCGASGDVIQYVQRIQNLDFVSALDQLAEEYGIERKTTRSDSEQKKQALYELNREAATHFYRNFQSSGNKGLEYMLARGIRPDTLKRFGIGYAKEGWTDLLDAMVAKGHDPERLLELGLVSKGKEKGKYFDKFRNRVMFPILNTRGKIIGFGGRALGEVQPKYLNSPESALFMKKNNLYGLNLTREDINKHDYALLVEGYMDVISLYQNGVTNVAASLGTALTEQQANLIKRYSRNIVLAYDADQAGQSAALRGMELLYREGLKVKILSQDQEKDPDEYIKKYGKEAFLDLIKRALPFAEYKIAKIKGQFDLATTEGRVNFLSEVSNFLKTLAPMEADVYIQNIASDTRISEGAIRREVGWEQEPAVPLQQLRIRPGEEGGANAKAGRRDLLEKNLIRLMIQSSRFVDRISSYQDVFRNPMHYQLVQHMKSIYQDDQEIDLKSLMDTVDPDQRIVLQEILDHVQIAGNEDAIFADCIQKIEREPALQRQEEILHLLPLLDEELDQEKIEHMTKELIEIQKIIQKNSHTVGETGQHGRI